MEQIRALGRKLVLMIIDGAIIAASFHLALNLRFQWEIPPEIGARWTENGPWMVALYLLAFALGGLYEVMWQYAGVRDLTRLAVLVAIPNALIFIINAWVIHGVLHNTVMFISAILAFLFIGGIRFVWRWVRFILFSPQGAKKAPVLIVGAGNAAAWAVTLCKQKENFGNPVVMVDDDLKKKNLRVQGVPVRGIISDVPELVRKYHIQEIVIAIPTLRGERLREVVNLCTSTRARVRMLNDPQLVEKDTLKTRAGLREINTSDFLSRDEVVLDADRIRQYLAGKTVLVTGGGGSIGSELCRQIIKFNPKQLLVFDIYENCAYELEMELKRTYGQDVPVKVLIGSIRDKKRLDEVFEKYHPEVVFHAAAHKHVPLMEISPAEAVKNNVMGTKNLLSSASAHGVERFVQLSTDKAVNPTNVMGCTKRLCELLLQAFAKGTEMKCMAVRFGNVLGSHGSVIPLFESQIRKGGPVTITHPDIVRYFMTIPEAAQLVLQAGSLAESGSIYVLDMGAPVKIMDLAKKLIRFYGYEPGVDMDIVVTGLRPGEKLYEELMLDAEQEKMQKTAHNKIFVAPPSEINVSRFYEQLNELNEAAEHNDEGVIRCLEKMVPTYHPNREMLKGE